MRARCSSPQDWIAFERIPIDLAAQFANVLAPHIEQAIEQAMARLRELPPGLGRHDAGSLTLVEAWSSHAKLDRHLQSDARMSLIAAMGMSSVTPAVRFDTIEQRDGLEFIAKAFAQGENTTG